MQCLACLHIVTYTAKPESLMHSLYTRTVMPLPHYGCFYTQNECMLRNLLSLYVPETKIGEVTNSVGFDEVAHNDHLDLYCLPCNL